MTLRHTDGLLQHRLVHRARQPARRSSDRARLSGGCRRTLACVSIGALMLSVLLFGRAGYLLAKANLAQVLLARAWSESLDTGSAQPPWPWADMVTAARLEVPSLGQSLIVLSDASGEAMAFGPGLAAGSPERAATETVAIGGHRDSHLAWLQDLQPGAALTLQNLLGDTFHYELQRTFIVDSHDQALQIAADQPGLVLITCYPFNAMQTGGPLRFVAVAREPPLYSPHAFFLTDQADRAA